MAKIALFGLLAFAACATGAVAQEYRPDPRLGVPIATPNLKPLTAPQLPYRYAPGPVAPNGEQFGNIGSVALTPAGNLLVFNRNPSIQMVEYDANMKLVRVFNPNIAINAHGMRTDRHGNIWVVDSFLNVVWKLNPKGEPLMALGKRGEVGPWTDGAWNGMFNQPVDVAFDADDNLYVVQGHGGTSPPPDCTYCATYTKARPSVTQGSDPRIIKFDKTGNFVASRSLAHGPTERYPYIHTAVVTAKGELWLGDRQVNKILVLDRDLRPLREIQQPVLTSGLFVDAKGMVWLAAGMDGMVASLDANGKITGWYGNAGKSNDPANPLIGEAHYLAVTPDQKKIYLADSVNAQVLVMERIP